MSSQLVQILQGFIANDNEIRRQAEVAFNQLQSQNLQQLILQLTSIIATQSYQPDIRILATVLLRIIIRDINIQTWRSFTPQNQTTVKQTLIQVMGNEESIVIPRKVSHTIAQLSSLLLTEHMWPEIEPFVFSMCNSSFDQHREIGLGLLDQLLEYCGASFISSLQQLVQIFSTRLDDSRPSVRPIALNAVCSCLTQLHSKEDIQSLKPLLPKMMKILEFLLVEGDEPTACSVLEALANVADHQPQFFRDSLAEVCHVMVLIASNESLISNTRLLAVEFLVVLSENASSTLRKHQNIFEGILKLILGLMCQVEYTPGWEAQPDPLFSFGDSALGNGNEEDMSDPSALSLDRIAKALGGQAILSVLFPMTQVMLGSDDWKQRRTALFAFAIVAEGCKKLMYSQLPEIVPAILYFCCNDQHVRVRYAAIHCIGQFAQDFGSRIQYEKNFQDLFHAEVFQMVITSLGPINSGCPRIYALTTNMIVNFCDPESCKSSYVLSVLDPILQILFQILHSSPVFVQQSTLTAIAILARLCSTKFSSYYDIFVPLVKNILVQASPKDMSILRGKAIEAISLIGQAVGREKFTPDAQEVMNLLLSTEEGGLVPGDTQAQYILNSCARIASVLREDFIPYMNIIVPIMLQTAAQLPETTPVDTKNNFDPSNFEGFELIEQLNAAQEVTIVGINSSQTQEKEIACRVIYQMVKDLGHLYLPFAEETCKVVLECLKWRYLVSIQSLASATLPLLLLSAIRNSNSVSNVDYQSKKDFAQRLFNMIVPGLRSLLLSEQNPEEMEGLCVVADSLTLCLKYAKESHDDPTYIPIDISTDFIRSIFDTLKTTATSSIQRRFNRQMLNQSNEDYDEEDELKLEDIEEWEEDVMTSCVDGIGWIIKTKKRDVLPLLHEMILPFVFPLLSQPAFDLHSFALCVGIDAIEYCGEGAHGILPLLIPKMIEGVSDESRGMRHASIYGIGVLAQYGGEQFSPYVPQCVDLLFAWIQHEGAKSEDNILITDNAISSLLKFARYRKNLVNYQQCFLTVWQSLPLVNDTTEAKEVHKSIVEMIENKDDLLNCVGFNLAMMLPLFAALMLYRPKSNEDDIDIITWSSNENDEDAFYEYQIVYKKTRIQMDRILQNIFQTQPEELLHQIISQLPQESQIALQTPTKFA